MHAHFVWWRSSVFWRTIIVFLHVLVHEPWIMSTALESHSVTDDCFQIPSRHIMKISCSDVGVNRCWVELKMSALTELAEVMMLVGDGLRQIFFIFKFSLDNFIYLSIFSMYSHVFIRESTFICQRKPGLTSLWEQLKQANKQTNKQKTITMLKRLKQPSQWAVDTLQRSACGTHDTVWYRTHGLAHRIHADLLPDPQQCECWFLYRADKIHNAIFHFENTSFLMEWILQS